MKQRLDYLDTAKGIAIILVILGHIISPDDYLVRNWRNWLYSFHMPIFFIISGFLINLSNTNISITKFIKKKFNTLIIPYISFALINFCFIMYNLYMQQGLNKKIFIVHLIYIIKLCGRSAIWFLPCLFISEVSFKILTCKISNKYLRLIIISSLFIIPFFIKADPDTLFLVFLRSFTALGFITVGNLLYKPIANINLSIFKTLIFFIITIFLGLINGSVDLFALTFNNIIMYIINSILGSLSLIFLCKKISLPKLITYIGKNSLIIMGTHIIIKDIVITFLIKTLSLDITYLYPYKYYELLLFIIILIEIPLISVFNNHFSLLLGKPKVVTDFSS